MPSPGFEPLPSRKVASVTNHSMGWAAKTNLSVYVVVASNPFRAKKPIASPFDLSVKERHKQDPAHYCPRNMPQQSRT
ncbi:hypothetical protein TNCV_4050221 [Trichonephila clavipes]|nr:hypothetical protein TNCV_4050221 [Trichonephila clavipes]